MFSPVSQISNPSSPFFPPSPFISSFTPSTILEFSISTVLFQLNLGLSMDSTTFVISLISSLPPSPHLQSLPSFLLPPSTLVLSLSPPFHLMCFMVYPLSQFSSFPLISSFPFHSLSSLSSSISSIQQSSLPPIWCFQWTQQSVHS